MEEGEENLYSAHVSRQMEVIETAHENALWNVTFYAHGLFRHGMVHF